MMSISRKITRIQRFCKTLTSVNYPYAVIAFLALEIKAVISF